MMRPFYYAASHSKGKPIFETTFKTFCFILVADLQSLSTEIQKFLNVSLDLYLIQKTSNIVELMEYQMRAV